MDRSIEFSPLIKRGFQHTIKTIFWSDIADKPKIAVLDQPNIFEGEQIFRGDISIDGSIYQAGGLYETHVENLFSVNELLMLRDGAMVPLPPGSYSGIQINMGETDEDIYLVSDRTGTVFVGEMNDLQPLSTRELAPVNNAFGFWNELTNRYETSPNATLAHAQNWHDAYAHALSSGNVHNLQINDIPNLTAELLNKTNLGHSHAVSDVQNLQNALDSKLNKSGGVLTGDIWDKTNSFVILDADEGKLFYNGQDTDTRYLGSNANADSASKLFTPRTIAGVSFDGTANINIPFANLSSKPNTLAGYGITDAVPYSGATSGLNLGYLPLTAGRIELKSDANALTMGHVTYDVLGISPNTTAIFARANSLKFQIQNIGGTNKYFHLQHSLISAGAQRYYSLPNADGTFALTSDLIFSNISAIPTTLAGYGITDAALAIHNHDAAYLGINGNAVSASKLLTARTIAGVSFDGTANINIPFANLSSKPTTLTGYGITDAALAIHNHDAAYLGINANAVSASKLLTARTIAGVSFDGSANINIPFANLSSKPTTLAGYGITDANNINSNWLANENRIQRNIYVDSENNITASSYANKDINSWVYAGKSFSISSQESAPTGLFFDSTGTRMYVCGSTGDDVNQYSLSTPFDVSTASFIAVSSTIGDTVPEDVYFNPTGTKMYIIGSSGDAIREFDLSVAWDITTAIFLQSFSVAAQDTVPNGLYFTANGLKMFISGGTNDAIYEYNLGTAWNIATAVYSGKSLSVSAYENGLTSLEFSDDGTKLFIIGTTFDSIIQFNLIIPWDISSAVYYGRKYIGFQEATPSALWFEEAQNKMFIVGSSADTVYEYKTDNIGFVHSSSINWFDSQVEFDSNIYVKGMFHASGNAYVLGSLTIAGSSSFSTTTISGTLTSSSTTTLATGTGTQTVALGAGANTSGTTKTLNLGTAGLSGSNTIINIGSAISGANSTINLNGTINASFFDTRYALMTHSHDQYYKYKSNASGIPSTIGAGNIDFANETDYYSATSFTGNVTWTAINVDSNIDKVIAIDCKPGTYSVTLAGTGLTFEGDVNASKVVQGLDTTGKSNLITLWAITSTRIWVKVLKSQA